MVGAYQSTYMIYASANSQSNMPLMQPLQPQNELLMYASTQYSKMAVSHILSWTWVEQVTCASKYVKEEMRIHAPNQVFLRLTLV